MKTKSLILDPSRLSYTQSNLIIAPIKYREFQVTDTPGYDYIFRNKRLLWNDVKKDWLQERCPLGKLGAKIAVKETWTQYPVEYPPQPEDFWYKAFLKLPLVSYLKVPPIDTSQGIYKWKHGKFMPKEAVRYWLVIKDIEILTVDEIKSKQIVNPEALSKDYNFYWLCSTKLRHRGFNV